MLNVAPTHQMPVSVHVLRYVSRVLVRAAIVSGALLPVGWFLAAAVARGVFGLTGASRTGLGRFLENWNLAAGVGLGAALAMSQFTLYFQHRAIREVLDQIAADPAAPQQAPVAWQHVAVRRKRAGIGLQLLGFPIILFCGFMGGIGIYVAAEEPANWLAITLSITGPLFVALGIWMIYAGSREVAGPARDRWGLLQSPARTHWWTRRPSVLGTLLTATIVPLVVGAAGVRTGPEYPISDSYWVFRVLATGGGIGLLFHASGWFARR